MALNPRQMLGLGNARPSMRYQQLNQSFQSDPRRILGQALMQQGASAAPVRTPLQGLGRLSSALVGAYLQRKAGDAQVERETAMTDQIMGMLGPNVAPNIRAAVAANPAAAQTALLSAQFAPTSQAFTSEVDGGGTIYGTRITSPLGPTSETVSGFAAAPKPTKPLDSFRPLNPSEISAAGFSQTEAQDYQINETTGKISRLSGSAPTINIDQTGERTVTIESAKAGVAALGEDDDKFEANLELLNRLDVARDLLSGGMDTGQIQSILLPFRKLGVDLGFIDGDEAEALSNQEVFNAISNYLIPRMRVAGSGATSNTEGADFARATITIDKNPRSNFMILAGMRQLALRQNRLILEKEDWFYDAEKGNGSFKGFKKWAEENVPPAFLRIQSDEELTKSIDNGNLSVGEAFFDAKNKRYEILTEEMLDG